MDLKMEAKDMKKTGWRRCVKKDYIARDCQINGIPAKVSLSVLREVSAPLTIHYDFGNARIADTDYAWLQIALKEQYFWLTAMYSSDGQLIQLYFDITAGNQFDDPENPWFRDMYLDIVVTNTGRIHVLDQDELDDALNDGAITKEEYDHAEMVCRKLHTYLTENKETVIALCNQSYHELKSILTEK